LRYFNKYLFVFVFSLIAGAWGFSSLFNSVHLQTEKKNLNKFFKKDSLVVVKLSAVGDLMCHSAQLIYARLGKDSFNFNPVFKFVKKYFDSSDFVMGNLETVINSDDFAYTGYPTFNSPPQFLKALKFAGFNHLFLANNHILDANWVGLKNTIQELNKFGLTFSGVKLNKNRAKVTIANIKGIKIALIAFTYLLNKNSEKGKQWVELLNERSLKNRILKAKKSGSDLIVVYFHFGKEYETTPTKKQKYFVKKAIEFGADIIIASHPHVVQPIDFIASSNSVFDSVFVCYSMGNFLSNQRWRFSNGGIILNFYLQKNFNSDKIKLIKVSYLPVWIFKGKINNKRQFLIFPQTVDSTKYPKYFTQKDIRMCRQSFTDSDSLIHSLGGNISREKFNLK